MQCHLERDVERGGVRSLQAVRHDRAAIDEATRAHLGQLEHSIPHPTTSEERHRAAQQSAHVLLPTCE